MHYSQIGLYEEKGAQPSADILAKLANALEVTSDFLMNGTSDDLADSSLTDKELLNQFKIIEKMTDEKNQWLKYSSMLSSPRIKSNSLHHKQKAPELRGFYVKIQVIHFSNTQLI